MDSLDDIWDDPIDATGNEDQPQASSSKKPLFLADSDDDEGPRPMKAPTFDVDIDAIFADVENDDEAFNIQPLTSKLDSESLRREAEARHKRNMPSLTPHAILSSSPPREMGDDESRSTSKVAGGEKGKDGKKERKKPMRLDEGRLLGPTGFPKLIKDTKDFKIKGKGHEATDLNRLLQLYGYWTHEMYPKTTFRDTVERVEKLCHSKRMHVALSVWRDEAKGLVNGRKPEEDDVIDLTENKEETEIRVPETDSSRGFSPVSGGAAYASSSSLPPSRPPSSGTEPDDDDDFDIDAVIRAEEERQAREHAGPSPSFAPTNAAPKGKAKVVVDDDEDESMWDAIDAMENFPHHQAPPTTTSRTLDDEDAMWDELHALEVSTAAVAAPTKQPIDEDEDMWDVVREMENGAAQKPQPTSAMSAAAPPPLPILTTQEDEDEWESMYA